MESDSDKRDTERVLILGDLQGEIMVFEPLHIKEISCGGASVETRFPLAPQLASRPAPDARCQSVVLKGRVAHSRISDVDQEIVTYRTGIEFVEPVRSRSLGDRRVPRDAQPTGELAAADGSKPAAACYCGACVSYAHSSGIRDSRPTRCAPRGRAARCRNRPTRRPRSHHPG